MRAVLGVSADVTAKPHPHGGIGMGERTTALLMFYSVAVCSGGAVDPRQGPAGVGLVNISERPFGRTEHPNGVGVRPATRRRCCCSIGRRPGVSPLACC